MLAKVSQGLQISSKFDRWNIMSITEILLISFALAMDAFAVSVASGFIIRQVRIKHALTMGLWFGVFQAIMPVAGWYGGKTLYNFMSGFDHWVAFVLLAFIGSKMIYESLRIKDIEEDKKDPMNMRILFILAVATSIDAFAVGLSLAFLKVSILLPVLVIGAVTFAMSFAGVYIGARGSHFFEKKIEIIGGLILIGIGIKIFLSYILA